MINGVRSGRSRVMSTNPLTMHDVARAAGVSVATVSRVVNDNRYVGEATRRKVRQAIDELGFQPNRIAQTLRPGQATATIALIIEDIANPFSSAIAQGVEEVARRQDHLLLISTTDRSVDQQRDLMREVVRRRVDGMLVMAADGDHTWLRQEIGRWGPIVFIDRLPRGVKGDVVLLDNYGGARQAVQYLLGRGHHRISYVGGASRVTTGRRRLAGYRQALTDADCPVDPGLLSLGNHDAAAAAAATERLYAARQPPTAIFADNNRMSVGVLQALHRLRVPLEMAGFDDLELAELLAVPTALVSYDAVELGRCAAQMLFARVGGDDGPLRRIVLPTSLIVHDPPQTCRPGATAGVPSPGP
jgi:LacI family transcriptional regulator